METGVLAGYPMIDIKATVYDGTYHEVDSSELAFKMAGSMAFRDAARKARAIILEPIMKLEVVTPKQFLGDIIGDLNSRRGHIDSIVTHEEMCIIQALVPLSETFGYATDLRSQTQGRATHTIEFSSYQEIPADFVDKIKEIAGFGRYA